MHSLRLLGLLGFALLAAPAFAQTMPNKMARTSKTRMVPNNTPAARAADPLRGKVNSKGLNDYAAPGQPVNMKDNGRSTPPYDGPAAGHDATPKGTTLPRKQ